MNYFYANTTAIDAIGGNEPVGDPSKMDDDDVVKMWERIRIINIINKLPSAEPEIIRCKDCRNNHWCSIQEAAMAGDNFFCGAAERKEDD